MAVNERASPSLPATALAHGAVPSLGRGGMPRADLGDPVVRRAIAAAYLKGQRPSRLSRRLLFGSLAWSVFAYALVLFQRNPALALPLFAALGGGGAVLLPTWLVSRHKRRRARRALIDDIELWEHLDRAVVEAGGAWRELGPEVRAERLAEALLALREREGP